MSCDPDVYDVANKFLPDGTPQKIREELAELVQTTIEDFINYGHFADVLKTLEAEEVAKIEARRAIRA